MALYYDRSRAQEEGTALIPDMPGYSDFKDKPFAKMVTEQDQIWWLYWHFSNLIADNNLSDIDERLQAVEDDVAAIKETIIDMLAEIAALKRSVYAIATNSMTYDVTRGTFAASIATSRRHWQAHHFNGMTVEDMAQYTVEELSHMQIRHMAVDGRTHYMEKDQDNTVAEQDGYTSCEFNADEFVRKSDLTLIDTDNLANHEIMGVLKKDSASDYPSFIPYMRPLTAHDLANAMVRFDDNVVIPDETDEVLC